MDEESSPVSMSGPGAERGTDYVQTKVGRVICTILLVVGDGLVVAAVFSPWLDLTTSTAGLPHELHFGPWNVLAETGDTSARLIVCAFVLAGLVAVLGSLLLAFVQTSALRRIASLAVIGLALACLGAAFVVLSLLPTGLSLTSPYYTSTIALGGWMALAGLSVVALGSYAIIAE